MGSPKRKARKLSGPALPTTATRMEYHPSSLGSGATPRLSRMAEAGGEGQEVHAGEEEQLACSKRRS